MRRIVTGRRAPPGTGRREPPRRAPAGPPPIRPAPRPYGRRARPARDPDRRAAACRRPDRAARTRPARGAGAACSRRSAASTTRIRTASDASDDVAASSSARGRGIATTRSNRSSRARETLARYAAILGGRARALDPRIAAAAAGAEVHRRDQPESRREQRTAAHPCDGDDAVLKRLPQRLEHRPRELRQLVEEEHATVREADLARAGDRASADHGRGGGAVVRRPERRSRHEARAGRQRPRDGVDPGHLKRLRGAELREDRRKPPREHRLAGPGRPCEQEVVGSRRGELQCASSTLLATDVGEVHQRPVRAVERPWGRRLERLVAPQVADGLAKVTHADRLDPRKRCLGGRARPGRVRARGRSVPPPRRPR